MSSYTEATNIQFGFLANPVERNAVATEFLVRVMLQLLDASIIYALLSCRIGWSMLVSSSEIDAI